MGTSPGPSCPWFGSVNVLHCNPDETSALPPNPGVPFTRKDAVTCAVMLPGSGSDERFIRSVFAAPWPGSASSWSRLRRGGGPTSSPGTGRRWTRPGPGRCWWAGSRWGRTSRRAGRPRRRADGWRGCCSRCPRGRASPRAAPAALAARSTAAQARAGGVAARRGRAAGAPSWLVAELGRAWAGYGDGPRARAGGGGRRARPHGGGVARRSTCPSGWRRWWTTPCTRWRWPRSGTRRCRGQRW